MGGNPKEGAPFLAVRKVETERPDSVAGAPGFEPGNGGIKIQLVRGTYQYAFRKICGIRPKIDQ